MASLPFLGAHYRCLLSLPIPISLPPFSLHFAQVPRSVVLLGPSSQGLTALLLPPTLLYLNGESFLCLTYSVPAD